MQILIQIFLYTCIYLIISCSFSIIYRTSRFFHIAHASIITLSGYIGWFLLSKCHFHPSIAFVTTIIISVSIGLLSELIIYRPLRKQQVSAMKMMIASLGLYIILQNLISIIWDDKIGYIQKGDMDYRYEFLGAYITDIQIITIILCVVLWSLYSVFIKYTQIGRNIRAVSSNSELSNIMGISSDNAILWAFGVGSFIASISGLLIAYNTSIISTMGFDWMLYGVVTMIIGGIKSSRGAFCGALLLSTTQHIAAYYIGSQWMNAIAYIILTLFLIIKPTGFGVQRIKKIEI